MHPVYAPLVLETGYKPYPFGTLAVVIGQPAVSPTGTVGANPWDHEYGPRGKAIGEFHQVLPIGTQPKTGL